MSRYLHELGSGPRTQGWSPTGSAVKMHLLTNVSDFIVDSNTRLRIAARIHFALLRHYGEDVAVSALLRGEGDAREALWVCEASGDNELIALARQFNAPTGTDARPADAPVGPRRPVAESVRARMQRGVPLDTAWSQDSSGFDLSRPPEIGDATLAKPSASWLNPARWLRGSAAH